MDGIGGELRGLLTTARDAARCRKQDLSTAHLLLAMLQSDGEVSTLLTTLGMRESDLLSALRLFDEEPNTALDMAFERARKLAAGLGEKAPRGAHLLMALAREPRTAAHRCLTQSGANAKKVQTELASRFGMRAEAVREVAMRRTAVAPPRTEPRAPTTPAREPLRRPHTQGLTHTLTPRHPARTNSRVAHPKANPVAPPKKQADVVAKPKELPRNEKIEVAPRTAPETGEFALDRETYPLLSTLGRNLTQLAADGLIDPVIGRESEIETLLDTLARRRANNPLLVGPPGVGKTAIVEGLAQKLAQGDSLGRGLTHRIVIEISAGSLVAGTGVRGALSDKLTRLRAEIARSEGKVLVFFDEVHALATGADGPDDLANELKSALARGELPCIGATTEAEYKKHIERDPALARRFTRVDVAEPKPADCVRILRGLLPRYELHHSVAYTKEAVEQAVSLSVRFLPDQKLPDKALSILDLAAARVRRRDKNIVDVEAIAEVVSEKAHVPLDRLLMRDSDRLMRLESFLGERVIGQQQPLLRIAEALRKGAAGFRGERPLGTFLLLGSTGVGKTETAKAISELLFSSTDMTRLDMSEYAEAHAVARLLGAPPGYVGHDDGGQLTEAVRRRPYQLVLLDEVEKAHPDVLLALLPLLDEGRLTDGRGRTVDFKNTVVVMTSNLGVTPARESGRIGFGHETESAASDGERALQSARRALPPELWNRIDEPLWFAPLTRFDVSRIACRMLDQVTALMEKEHGIFVDYEESAVDSLVMAGGFDASLGARPMRRTVGRLVESLLASAVLSHDIGRGDRVRLVGEEARIRIARDLNVDAAE